MAICGFLMAALPADAPLAGADLVLVAEAKLAELLGTEDELEASGVVVVGAAAYVVFDNTTRVARIELAELSSSGDHELLGNDRDGGFEGIAADRESGRFFAVAEAEMTRRCGRRFGASRDEHCLIRGRVTTLDADLDRKDRSWLGYGFQSDNKGFEGLVHVAADGDDYLLALCEGNDCDAGGPSRATGGGRIKVFEEEDDGWDYEASIRLPASLAFVDYSGLDLVGSRLAVVSQSSKQLWIGELGVDDWQVTETGEVFTFPATAAGERAYCNVEGVAWIPGDGAGDLPTRIVAVSDSRKTGSNAQDGFCELQEQSIHIFAVSP